MTEKEFRAIYPLLFGWIQEALAQFAPVARTVSSLRFRRLPSYYSEATLRGAKFVASPKVPVPPLSTMGLARFNEFERLNLGGITYLDAYFVRTDLAKEESLHFHELVHVIQWRTLGPERFLGHYADGLERFGYRSSPLEAMAYDLQARFDKMEKAFDVETEVLRSLNLR